MIKRTLYFGNPAYLSLQNAQLVIQLPEVEKNKNLSEHFKQQARTTVPVEDIGVVILDNKQITITHAVLSALISNNAAVVTTDDSHLPNGLFLPLVGHSEQSHIFKHQLEASIPLKKNLWQQTVIAKIKNQASVLSLFNLDNKFLLHLADSVKSGDTDNHEARASAHYWESLASLLPPSDKYPPFRRHRNGPPPNNLLNYAYAILRAIAARALISSGLLPIPGIFHKSKYNAYCLADDIMEPYRPFVDLLVFRYVQTASPEDVEQLTVKTKKHLLSVPVQDVWIENEKSPLMIALTRTSASLSRCFCTSQRKISYPSFNP
jgi:CRISPR-associated protein Cas1